MANTGKTVFKGILYIILIIGLIICGIYLTNLIESSTAPTIPFLNYLPLVCYVGAIFVGLLFITSILNSIKKTRSIGTVYQQGLLLLVLVFAFIPLLSPIIDQGTNNQNFSVYNSNWNGCSEFSNTIENEGYEVRPIQSSLSATERINKSVLLVMLGPNKFYNPLYEIPYFIDFFNGSNSLLLCHDHGSTYELLWEIFFSNILNPGTNNIPVTVFPDGYLRDNQSFVKNPLFPVLQTSEFNDPNNLITRDITKNIVLSKATAAAGGPLIPYFGWDVVANTSGVHSFVDKNNDKKYEYEVDSIDLSFMAPYLGDVNESMLKLPLGYPFTPTVFMKKDLGNCRIFVSSDASLWNNELIDNSDYDNKQLAINVIDWLARQDEGKSKDDWVVAIDEAHIRPETTNDISSAGIFGYLMRYIIQLSTNPLTAWIYPLLAIYTLRKFLPRDSEEKEKKEIERQEKKEDKLRFRTSSFFAKKINWYHEKKKYRQAILLLYRRLERKLNAQLGDRKITPKNVVEFIEAKETDVSKGKLNHIAGFIDFILDLKAGKTDIGDKETFENYYYEMQWVVNNT